MVQLLVILKLLIIMGQVLLFIKAVITLYLLGIWYLVMATREYR